ncbi:hypothetical protein [Cellulomonas sp. P5_E12]
MADPKPNATTTVLPLWTPSLPALWVLTGLAVAVVVFAILTRTVGSWFVAASSVMTTATIWIRRRGPKRES